MVGSDWADADGLRSPLSYGAGGRVRSEVRLVAARSRWWLARRGRRLCLLLGVCVATLAAPAGALASGDGDGCNPGRADNFNTAYDVGVYQYTPGLSVSGGIRAYIDNYSPFVKSVSGSTDDDSEWVMLSNPDNYYEQIGWLEQPYAVRYTFAEYGSNGGAFYDHYHSSDPINTNSDYEVAFHPNTNEFYFYDGGNEYWDYIIPNGTDPVLSEIYTESHTKASQVSGGTNNHNNMYSASFFYPAGTGGSWHDSAATPTNNTNNGSGGKFGGIGPNSGTTDNYYTWDWACTN
jgi:hypothetical protein